jgi:hypothetical protein
MKIASRLIGLTASIALAFTLASCGGGGGGSDGGIGGSGAQMGTLSIAITDAPSCGYDEVNITIEKIRVNQSSSAGDTEGGWSEIVLSPAKRVDLNSARSRSRPADIRSCVWCWPPTAAPRRRPIRWFRRAVSKRR